MAPIVILTGAGISAESGIRTFRAADGLWEEHRIEDVATPEGFLANPGLVHRFYNERRRQLRSPEVRPNAAHLALARLEQARPGEVFIITQNIDDLHERAGSRRVHHMHGSLLTSWCLACDERVPTTGDVDGESICPECGVVGRLRPDVVWFGEIPYGLDVIEQELRDCAVFAAVGTSGNVYPAAGFVQFAAMMGARTVELNLEASLTHSLFDEVRQGPATVVVPKWVEDLTDAT